MVSLDKSCGLPAVVVVQHQLADLLHAFGNMLRTAPQPAWLVSLSPPRIQNFDAPPTIQIQAVPQVKEDSN